MEQKKIRVAITHGDTNGIGYELILKVFEDPAMFDLCTPIVYGSPKVAAYHRKALDVNTQFSIIDKVEDAHDGRLNLVSTFDEEVKIEFGQATEESEQAARKAIARAKEDLKQGLYDVLVQAPMAPHAASSKEDRSLTIMVCDKVRIGLLTNHLPIKEVPQAVTTEKIVDKARIFFNSLKRDFRISNPRLAILALNPQMGTEEQEIILPAVEELEKNGIQAFGPYLADDFFVNTMYYNFDGVLAMYDDQGIVPFQALASDYGVKFKAGISVVCTTPNHGPAFDIAGKGIADEQSMRHAIYTAIDMFRYRDNYDEPLSQPLPKLYHEKREDGEKARFAVKFKDPVKRATAPEEEHQE